MSETSSLRVNMYIQTISLCLGSCCPLTLEEPLSRSLFEDFGYSLHYVSISLSLSSCLSLSELMVGLSFSLSLLVI